MKYIAGGMGIVIRFCDKEEYVIQLGDMTRSQMLLFFLSSGAEHRNDIITVMDGTQYYGIVTYQRVLNNLDEELVINRDILRISDNFWEDAKKYFEKNPEELLPVADLDGNVLGFAYDDNRKKLMGLELVLRDFEDTAEIPVSLSQWQPRCQQIVIWDLNEWAWRCYRLFQREGYPVCCIGEKWEWFGVRNMEGFYDFPDYSRMYVYAEGSACFRKYELVDNAEFLQSFGFFVDWKKENMKYLYKEIIQRLYEKEITVCCCAVPEFEIEYLTENEMKCKLNGVGSYNPDVNMYKSKNKKLLKTVAGTEAYEMIMKGSVMDYTGWKSVLLDDNGCAYALQDVSKRDRVYLIGPCIVAGEGCVTKDTLAACIQEYVQADRMVVKVPVVEWGFFKFMHIIEKLPIRKNDIVIFCTSDNILSKVNINKLDLSDVYNNTHREDYFINYTLHTNKNGNKAIAAYIYDKYLKDEIQRKKASDVPNIYLQKGEVLGMKYQYEINKYVQGIRVDKEGVNKTGAVVMNCNPFTSGHRYLIEYAAAKVDLLYVFVVEEDKSEYAFEDRIELVKRGTEHISNVAVVPSGNWVLSYNTMPIYFEKSIRREEKADAELDLQIFARYIAPQLNISVRFVGEEPIDKITKQYNEQMQEILCQFGIEVEEIPRKRCDGNVISASAVRKYVQEENWEMVQRYVPETTYQYLKEIFEIKV